MDVCSRVNIDNQPLESNGDTLHELTQPLYSVYQSPLDSCISMDIRASFWRRDAPPGINQLQIRGETLEFGNLFSDS